ncbi:histone-lysine N-methyltransferase SETMAR-like [Parambassis ranga]|uniref:Histone-lysine N-methyltransferase SETMAR-like n=1 Tax=Parambassis ranga TaxID=210632 RepID=A0A6P7J138_9TELE|nr:histone-lysine N-methyltransferase SETMAR-like [Parambassis ranga]
MDNVSLRAIIRYLGLKGLSPKEVHKDMVATLGAGAPSYSMVKKWAAEFKRGRENLEDEPRSGRPVTVTTQETIDKIRNIILTDRRITQRYIASELGISQERVHAVIHGELQMTKALACWVPKLLGPDEKQIRLSISKDNLALFDSDPQRFLQQFVTVDEIWIHHFQPETKEHSESPAPKKIKLVRSTGKVMVSVFWDAEGVLLVYYQEKGHTLTGAKYADLLRQLHDNIKNSRPGKLAQGVLFHQDNTPVHKSTAADTAIQQCRFELVLHPPYSPDLSPSDYYLFPKMKKELSGRHVDSDDDIIAAVDHFLEVQNADFYTEGIRMLHERWTKCVNVGGDYIEI